MGVERLQELKASTGAGNSDASDASGSEADRNEAMIH